MAIDRSEIVMIAPVVSALRKLRDAEVEAIERARANCLTLSRAREIAESSPNDWGGDSGHQVCPYCRKLVARFEQEIRKHSVAVLFAQAAATADPKAHIDHLLRSTLFSETVAKLPSKTDDFSHLNLASGFAQVPQLAGGHFEDRPRFHIRVELPDARLTVTVRETDYGELLLEAQSHDESKEGASERELRVEIIGEHASITKTIMVAPGGRPYVELGKFAEFARDLGDYCSVLASVVS